jgi:hypothetical protein
MMRTMIRGVAAALAVGVMAILATLALGAEVTRESYVAVVEPICKANSEANERILAGVQSEVRQGKLRPAATQFAKAARALRQTLDELRTVAQPTSDKPRLTKWFGHVKAEVELFEATAADLKAGQKAAAEHNSARLTSEANLANDQVLPFEFHYCRAEPSRFM